MKVSKAFTLLALFLLAFLGGCVSHGGAVFTTMVPPAIQIEKDSGGSPIVYARDEIKTILVVSCMNKVSGKIDFILDDRSYVLPKHESMIKYSRWFGIYTRDWSYAAESEDCDNFANSFADKAPEFSMRSNRSVKEKVNAQLSVGVITVRLNSGVSHALCFWLDDQGLWIIEPQNIFDYSEFDEFSKRFESITSIRLCSVHQIQK